ncbi:MAG: nucleotidyltransferase domain-containing protein [Promethearchaeia archaeon]
MLKKKFSEIKNLLEGHPKADKLINFLKSFYKNYSAEFIILFGSGAKGNFNYKSDIDLLIVSDAIKGNYFSKLRKMFDISKGGIDFFVYSTEEFKKMVNTYHLLAIEALANGILLYDKGLGKNYKNQIRELVKTNKLQRSKHAWVINT